MVGFDPSIAENFKFETEFSVPEFPEFEDPFREFEFPGDWGWQAETFDDMLPIPIEENPVPDCSDIKSFDFDRDRAMEEALQKPITIDEFIQDPIVSDSKTELGVDAKSHLVDGSLIEKEMGKVSLVGWSESSNLEGGERALFETGENGVGGDGVSMVVDCGSEMKEKEGGNGVDEVTVVVESENSLKVSAFGDGENEMQLAMDQAKADDASLGSKPEIEKSGIGEEDSESSDEESDSDSSDSESESDSSSSSSSSSEEEEEEDGKGKKIGESEEGEIEALDEELMLGCSDEEGDVVKGPIKSKNEIEVLPPVPPVNVTLEPHHETSPVGEILSIMGNQVVVEGLEKHNPLSEGSILWLTETRAPLGLVDEIFGPVKNPYYIVRYNSGEEIPAGVGVGAPVSFVAQFADFVLNDSNLYKKGYDASGENDEELSDEVEFSDDEKEAEYRRAQRAGNGANDKKRGNHDSGNQKKFQQKSKAGRNSQPPKPFVAPLGQPSNSPSMGHPSKYSNIGQPSNMRHPSNNPNYMGQPSNMGNPSNNPNMGQPSNMGYLGQPSNMGHPSNNPNMGQPLNMGYPSNNPNMGQPSNMGHPSCNPNIGLPTNMGPPSNNPNQLRAPPAQAAFASNSFGCAFGSGPDSVNGSASVPPAPQAVQNNSFTPQNTGFWMNGVAFLPQQQMFFPNSFQMNGMPPQLLNPHQQQPQMFTGYPPGMQIQQQFNPNQRLPPNGGLPYGQANATPGQSTSWPGFQGQPAANQTQFGMGFQGQPTTLNAGGTGAFPNGSFNQQTNAMRPSANFQGNFTAPSQFSQGANSTRGRPHRHRGGNLSGRRGRQ